MKTKTSRPCALAMVAVLAAIGLAPAAFAQSLTPNGAEASGNKDGSIPAWTGGLSKAPDGWKPGAAYADPFKDEKPVATITAQNADQYKDKLSPGLLGLLKKYPETFKVPVYPTHRTFANPQSVYDATKSKAGSAKLNGLKLEYALPGTPYPTPKTGVEAMYNHLLQYFGGYKACRDWLPVRANGSFYRVGFCQNKVQGQNMTPSNPNNLYSLVAYYDMPSTLVGTIYLVLDPIDKSFEGRQAWIYNAGQRRVRRAPDLAYDGIEDGSEGMRTIDGYFGFQGALDRYDWKLVGKQEKYIPYNAYKLQDPKLKYKDMLGKGFVKSDLMRYELHRVWVVEATLKKGASHTMAKRVFYLDEDSYSVALAESYDSRGNLWRVHHYPLFQAYDAGVMLQTTYVDSDLSNGNYIVTDATNERPQPVYQWNVKGTDADFSVDAIRRKGVR
jgi:predicted acetyltransferase